MTVLAPIIQNFTYSAALLRCRCSCLSKYNTPRAAGCGWPRPSSLGETLQMCGLKSTQRRLKQRGPTPPRSPTQVLLPCDCIVVAASVQLGSAA